MNLPRSPLVRCNKDLVAALFKDVNVRNNRHPVFLLLSFDLRFGFGGGGYGRPSDNGRRDGRTAIRYDG
jgi:hypothetical protein